MPQRIVERKLAVVGSLVFEIRSHEEGKHHYPHLHVTSNGVAAVFRIEDGTMVQSSKPLSPKVQAEAKTWILSNQRWIMECWNVKTDSRIKFDLNMYNDSGKIITKFE